MVVNRLSCCCPPSKRTTRTVSASCSTRGGGVRALHPPRSTSTSKVQINRTGVCEGGANICLGGALRWVEFVDVVVSLPENNSPLGIPVFNSSGPAYHIWKGVELAVSTFWPNYYQVTHTHRHTHTHSQFNLV